MRGAAVHSTGCYVSDAPKGCTGIIAYKHWNERKGVYIYTYVWVDLDMNLITQYCVV